MATLHSRLVLPVPGRDHIVGPPEAPAILLEYGDYECPHCGRAYPIIEAVRRQLGRRLQFAYRHFPLSEIHPHSVRAAEAAEAAGAQGRFWEMHGVLFENQHALEDEDLVNYAQYLRLDVPRFVSELSEGVWAPRVREDFMSGVRGGVNGTPTFFINGVRHDGPWDFDSLVEAIATAARLSA
jgi:protein-disulfide isomerase